MQAERGYYGKQNRKEQKRILNGLHVRYVFGNVEVIVQLEKLEWLRQRACYVYEMLLFIVLTTCVGIILFEFRDV